jgi:pimeloyl-ACP methyl ester carboxylesterase
MLTAEVVPPEGARYAASLVLVPGLWTTPAGWRRCAGFLAHRGWECHLLDVRDVAGGVATRGAAVAEYARGVEGRVVLVGYDAGAWIAAAAAAPAAAAAVALVAPLLPGGAAVRGIAFELRVLWALVAGRPVPAPAAADPLWTEVPGARTALVETAPADPAAAREILWGRLSPVPVVGVPALVVAGGRDPLLGPDAAAALATRLGSKTAVLPDAGHWLLGPRFFQATAGAVHRWIVQELGAPLLELYPEAMAAREAEEDES